ncbi:hypothetical protein [Nonomuraea dietziae]|uniref:Uncharacterized protein n=1 Tax=Nonomuraea dietziae TaxID=65515 RepID=A0A7W5VLZ5_9ACTN|nr:hypothetical protein [Nonomuraea dietziae]MBB3733855.1 hypothetical protein [Nonomuraea dietziae]
MIIAVIGVVFTAWFNARGPDVFDKIGGEPPIKIGHVDIDYSERDIALREPVTDTRERAILLGEGASDSQRDAVLARHHRAPLDHASVTVVLIGNRTNLRIVDIEPRVLARKPVSDGALAFLSTAGEADTVELAADLDAAAPRFTTTKDRNASYFRKKQIDLKRDERVTLSLTVVGKKAYYEFDFLVTALAEDRTEQIEIKGPDKGSFRLTGRADAYRSYYDYGWRPISHDQVCARRKFEGC